MPRTIKIMADRHLFTLIYSLRKVIKVHNGVLCNLCFTKLNLNCAGYYCQQCDFVAHVGCAPNNSVEPSDTFDSSIDLMEDTDFEGVEEGDVLKHFDHEHNLIVSRNQVEVHDHKLCEGCMQSISAPFYSCEQCNYFLHITCVRLPLKKRPPSHSHPLTLSQEKNYYIDAKGIEYCQSCGRYSHGFVYKCFYYSVDIRCCSIPKTFKHEVRQHSLYHAPTSVERCNACDWPKTPGIGVFVCTKCNFALGFECATLPLKARYENHLHPLLLTHIITAENKDSK